MRNKNTYGDNKYDARSYMTPDHHTIERMQVGMEVGTELRSREGWRWRWRWGGKPVGREGLKLAEII